MRYDNLTLTSGEFTEMWDVLCDMTPTEGRWVWSMEELQSVSTLEGYSPTYKRDKVVSFRNKIRAQQGHHIVKEGSRYRWVFDGVDSTPKVD